MTRITPVISGQSNPARNGYGHWLLN